MILITDNIAFAQRCIPHSDNWQRCAVSELTPAVGMLAAELFEAGSIMQTEIAFGEHWDYLFAVDRASQSQYDVLSRLAVSGHEIPDKVLCCAGSGDEFHGFKGRGWKACHGNIHLSAYITPQREIPGAAVGFMVAAVIAALQTVTLFSPPGTAPAIKWVNDILLGGAKVGGVLARMKTQGSTTESAVVGIGLNVEQKPPVERNPHVPEVAALSDFAANPDTCRHADVFPHLAEALGRNLESLCQGNFTDLLGLYRQHSLILDRHVTILEDTRDNTSSVIAGGLVESIGPSLELYIKDLPDPVSKGRLVLGNINKKRL